LEAAALFRSVAESGTINVALEARRGRMHLAVFRYSGRFPDKWVAEKVDDWRHGILVGEKVRHAGGHESDVANQVTGMSAAEKNWMPPAGAKMKSSGAQNRGSSIQLLCGVNPNHDQANNDIGCWQHHGIFDR